MEDQNNINNNLTEQQIMQMHNGDACFVQNEYGEYVPYAEYLYPNAEEDVACLGTD